MFLRRSFAASLALSALSVACGPELVDERTEESSAIVSSPPFYGDPANGAVFAVDISHWEGPISQREMDCFWDSGVRHVIAGTQVEEVTRQQLAMAVARGMTVDAYVYLYWDRDMSAQVEAAFARSDDFPIERMWIDVEQDPGALGANTLIELVEQALETCRAHAQVTCGIYTGPGFWKSSMNDTIRFGDVPLWYAWYNRRASLSRWSLEHFGGWSRPVAKQWAEEALCGVGVDKNVMQTSGAPAVVVDRSMPRDNGLPPPAPSGLYPAEGAAVSIDVVKLMTETIPRATRYELALETWRGSSFVPYYTWVTPDAFRRTFPPRDNLYRFRSRATNAHGPGLWSSWVSFVYGTSRAAPPSMPDMTDVTDEPAGLSPDGTVLSSEAVALRFDAVTGATRYELAIEYVTAGGAWAPYVAYTTSTSSKTFYPQIRPTTYRWRVHAFAAGAWGEWSSWATFELR